MKKLLLSAITVIAAAFAGYGQDADEAQLPAFPGAEGFGMYTTGGRGGEVYHVTNLDDKGEGSFRWACEQKGARTIVFDVSGTIMLQSELKLRNGDVTIAGQTAPGDGICVSNFPFVISAPNVIIRYMRFRLGNEALKTNKSAHEGDGLGGMDGRDIIIDHCSVSWSIDECLSVYGSRNFTVQWSISSHSLVNAGHSKGSHGYGGNWGGAGASYHHNLVANHGSRTPRFGPRPGTQKDERMDFRNNVIYNWGGNGCYGGEGMKVNVVNNYYKPGPATPSGTKGYRISGLGIRTVDYCLDKSSIADQYYFATGTTISSSTISGSRDRTTGQNMISIKGKKTPIDMVNNTTEIDVNGTPKTIKISWNSWKPMLHVWASLFIEGNVNPKYPDMTADNWKYGIYDQVDKSGNDYTFNEEVYAGMKLSQPLGFPSTTTHTAEVAYERVLDYVGASLHRDEYDAMVIKDAREGTASINKKNGKNGLIDSQDDIVYADGHTGWPELVSEPARVDTDGDGMPDDYETANGLDPMDPEDGKAVAANGYTNLENYLNSIVAHITEAQNAGGNIESSGIDSILADPAFGGSQAADNRTFDITGRQVYEALQPGVYIRGGKKFVVR
ncbi:MAG: hypothetical protein NC098_01525 [Lachnoclostridium sp.]|nr:hypothetical protein [Lachnoclostridium sp.]